jgi:hypothetical protein
MIWKLRHWEITVAGWHLSRWCTGAPCYLTPNQRHPVSLRRCAHRG